MASVVYGPPQDASAGKHSAGAPSTPAKTWFQTPFVHAVDAAVPRQPLLLRAVDDDAAGELRVGDEAAARERRARAVVHQRHLAVHLDAPHRRGLRDRPELAELTAALPRDVDRQVRQGAPEVVQRDAEATVALVVDVDRAVHDHVVRRGAEACDLGVVADLEVEGIRRSSVRAGHEEQRVALRPELVSELLRRDRVERRLDLGRRHARIEDLHVRAEVRGAAAGRGPDRAAGKSEHPGDEGERKDDDAGKPFRLLPCLACDAVTF